jgi:hypothetical protein
LDINQTVVDKQNIVQTKSAANKSSDNSQQGVWGEDGFTFGDVLDILNPLQHIPVVNKIYREVTGDEISDASRSIGGGVYGGIVGLVTSSANVLLKRESGQDLEDHIADMFNTEHVDPAQTVGEVKPEQRVVEAHAIQEDDLDEFFSEMGVGTESDGDFDQQVISDDVFLADILRTVMNRPSLRQESDEQQVSVRRQAVNAYSEVAKPETVADNKEFTG